MARRNRPGRPPAARIASSARPPEVVVTMTLEVEWGASARAWRGRVSLLSSAHEKPGRAKRRAAARHGKGKRENGKVLRIVLFSIFPFPFSIERRVRRSVSRLNQARIRGSYDKGYLGWSGEFPQPASYSIGRHRR